MTFSVFLLVMVSAFGWSLFDISRKYTGKELSPIHALSLYMLLSLPIIVVWAICTSTELKSSYWTIGLFGILINFVANWSFIESVSRAPLSLSIPMLAFVPVFSAVLSVIFLGESLLFSQWIGIGIVVAGAFVLNGLPKFTVESFGPWLMFLASIFWSIMLIVDKLSLKHASPPMHIAIQTVGVFLISWIWIKRQKAAPSLLAPIRKAGFHLWLGVLGCVVGAGIQLVVIAHADVSLVEPVKRAGNMLLSLIWGALLFGEPLTLRKFAAVGVLLWGTFLVLQVI